MSAFFIACRSKLIDANTRRFAIRVLSRKKSEILVLGGSGAQQARIGIVVLEIGNGFVKLGNEAPASVPVHRMEVWEQIQAGWDSANAVWSHSDQPERQTTNESKRVQM